MKLLDFVKGKDYTHQQVMDFLESQSELFREQFPIEEEGQEEEEEEEEEEIQTNDDKDKTKTNDNEKEQETINLSRDELTEIITAAIEEKFKANRKAPSKGKKIDKKLPDKNIVKRSNFEMIV